jgi:D-alanyl-D-alanine carboxypeptidase (penicillin-binding protein 5/6)
MKQEVIFQKPGRVKPLRHQNGQTKGGIFSLFFVVFICAIFYLLSTVFAAEISSKAAVVLEPTTGKVLSGKNPNLRLPPASTTKLMTAMVVLDRANLNDVVTISEKAAEISPIKVHLRPGERMTVRNLLYAALLRSSNDAAFALAEHAAGSEERFVEFMNQKAHDLDLVDTHFINATGLPGQGQYTTAYDLAKIMRNAVTYPVIREIVNTKESIITTEGGRAIRLRNINRLLWSDESMLGGKTGYTRAARHCFVCAGEQGHDMVIVAVLGAPSRAMLWRESEGLLGKGFAVKHGSEEPAVYFTKSDYNNSIHKASYKKKASVDKKATKKKGHKKKTKKAKRNAKKKKSRNHAGSLNT